MLAPWGRMAGSAGALASADPAMRPQGASKAIAFRFPAAAQQMLEQLDPRAEG